MIEKEEEHVATLHLFQEKSCQIYTFFSWKKIGSLLFFPRESSLGERDPLAGCCFCCRSQWCTFSLSRVCPGHKQPQDEERRRCVHQRASSCRRVYLFDFANRSGCIFLGLPLRERLDEKKHLLPASISRLLRDFPCRWNDQDRSFIIGDRHSPGVRSFFMPFPISC